MKVGFIDLNSQVQGLRNSVISGEAAKKYKDKIFFTFSPKKLL